MQIKDTPAPLTTWPGRHGQKEWELGMSPFSAEGQVGEGVQVHLNFKSWDGRHWGPRHHMGRGRFGRDSGEGEIEPAPTGEA